MTVSTIKAPTTVKEQINKKFKKSVFNHKDLILLVDSLPKFKLLLNRNNYLSDLKYTEIQELFIQKAINTLIQEIKFPGNIYPTIPEKEMEKINALEDDVKDVFANTIVQELIERIGKERIQNMLDEIDMFLKEKDLC